MPSRYFRLYELLDAGETAQIRGENLRILDGDAVGPLEELDEGQDSEGIQDTCLDQRKVICQLIGGTLLSQTIDDEVPDPINDALHRHSRLSVSSVLGSRLSRLRFAAAPLYDRRTTAPYSSADTYAGMQ